MKKGIWHSEDKGKGAHKKKIGTKKFIGTFSLQASTVMIKKVHMFKGAAAYQLGNTSSGTITEVKQCWARLVLGWEAVQVLPECCC